MSDFVSNSHIRSPTMAGYPVRCAAYLLYFARRWCPSLSETDLTIVIHSFATSSLDDCNVLYMQLHTNTIQKLQNAAASLSGFSHQEHILPVFYKQQHLPVNFLVKFQILVCPINPQIVWNPYT